MSGRIPPMAELNAVARACDAVLYIDDAHGTGVLGEQGRGTVLEALGSYDNTFVVGSLSKAFSCAGGFIGCPEPFQRLLKIRSQPLRLRRAGRALVTSRRSARSSTSSARTSTERSARGSTRASAARPAAWPTSAWSSWAAATPIVSVLIGDEADTLNAGKFLFDRGYYVQSVLFPGRPVPLPGCSASSATPITTRRRSTACSRPSRSWRSR